MTKTAVMQLSAPALASQRNSVASAVSLSKLFKDRTPMAKFRELFKLAFIILPPLVAVGFLAAMNVIRADENMASATHLQDNLYVAERIRHLVTMLQKERGMTCVFLNSRGSG